MSNRFDAASSLRRSTPSVQWVDNKAWIGQHHSAGCEIVASPKLFIPTAGKRTRHIQLGTGVSLLPYHHPLMLAEDWPKAGFPSERLHGVPEDRWRAECDSRGLSAAEEQEEPQTSIPERVSEAANVLCGRGP